MVMLKELSMVMIIQMGNMQKNKQAVDVLLNDALRPGCYQIFKDRYNITVNCQTANFNYFGDDKDKKIRSESQFIQDLIESHPGIVDSFKFSDNSKLGSFDGLFVCSSISKWALEKRTQRPCRKND